MHWSLGSSLPVPVVVARTCAEDHENLAGWLNDTRFAPHGTAGSGAPVFLNEEGVVLSQPSMPGTDPGVRKSRSILDVAHDVHAFRFISLLQGFWSLEVRCTCTMDHNVQRARLEHAGYCALAVSGIGQREHCKRLCAIEFLSLMSWRFEEPNPLQSWLLCGLHGERGCHKVCRRCRILQLEGLEAQTTQIPKC